MAFDAGAIVGKLKLDKGKWDSSVKQAGRGLTDLKRKSAAFGQAIRSHWIAITAAVIGTVMALKKVGDIYKDILKVSSTVEQFKVRLDSLLGSAKEGNKVFKEMVEFAGRVPKTYEEIMAAATDLSAVVRGGSEEIKKLMPIIVDISAGTGMAVREVTSNMIKMYSAGAAAADMLRDRGVLAALGFQAGVAYTAKETMDQLTGIWESGVGKYVGAAKKLAKTWEGAMSMMADAWFNFRKAIGEKFFKTIKSDINAILELIRISKEETGKYAEVVEELKDVLLEGYEAGQNFVVTMLAGIGQMIDGWNEFKLLVNSSLIGLLKINLMHQKIVAFLGGPFGAAARKRKEAIQELELTIQSLQRTNAQMANAAIQDWSVKIKGGIESVKQALGKLKSKQKEVVESTEEMTNGFKKAGEKIKVSSKDWFETVKDNFNIMEEASRNTFNALAQGFTDLFYNVFTGELNNMSDFFRQFCNAVLRGLASIVAQMVAIKIWGAMLGMFSGFGGNAAASLATGALSATPTVQTGTPYVPYTGLFKLHEGERVTPKYDAGKEEAQPLIIYNAITPEAIAQAMSGREGKNVIVNIIDTDSLRGGAIRRTIQRG